MYVGKQDLQDTMDISVFTIYDWTWNVCTVRVLTLLYFCK